MMKKKKREREKKCSCYFKRLIDIEMRGIFFVVLKREFEVCIHSYDGD